MYKLVFFIFIFISACHPNMENLYNRSYPLVNYKKETNLSLISKNNYNLFVAFDNSCPLCKSSIPTLNLIANTYPEMGIVLFYPSNQLDSSINEFIASALNKRIILIKDKNKALTFYFKAFVTPTCFVVSNTNKLIYKGAINSTLSVNWRKNSGTVLPYLLNALDTALVLNKELKNHENKALGCYIE